ncbi:hypothetical protein D3C86_2154800 [compost metagenome]
MPQESTVSVNPAHFQGLLEPRPAVSVLLIVNGLSPLREPPHTLQKQGAVVMP